MSCDIYSSNSTTYQFCHGESSRPWFVYALEAPNGRKAEAAIFLASACMFVLGCLLFGLSLFGRLSGRAALNPTVRVFLYASFSLFLPLMSYMFSQARDEAKLRQQQQQQYRNDSGGGDQHLPFRAQVILIWMLLVELLRKKVDAILAAMSSSPLRAVHHQTLWEAIDQMVQIVRIAWIGYLIYSYTHGFRRPGFIILWLLTLVKAAQRIAAVELAKRSYAVGKNAYLVVGYVTQMIQGEEIDDDQQASGPALLSKCWYAVMGEDKLKREAGPDGYRVELPAPDSDEMDLITVGNIWELAEGGQGKPADGLLSDHPKLQDLCLSFALYKLLRARFENRQVHDDVTRKNRDLIFRGVGSGDDDDTADAERVFHVIELELSFVSDYYHSVVPLVLSNPWFLVGNYLFVFLIILNQSIMVLFITGNGRLLPVIRCLARDVVTMSRRAISLFNCLGHKLVNTIIIMFSSFNILVSLLLVLTFLLMEAWEFVVYVLSDSFLVSLLCRYVARPKWQSSRCVRRAFGALLWVKRVGRPRTGMRFNQVCVLDLRRHTPWLMVSRVLQHRFLGMPSVPVPREVKRGVYASLRLGARSGLALSNGVAVLQRRGWTQLLWACESSSITQVILVWHMATSLLEMKSRSTAPPSADETLATTLSKYCAYLVACAPELLPEDREGSKRAYKAVKRHLRDARRSKEQRAESRLEGMMRMWRPEAVANMGAELGTQLVEECGDDAAQGWVLLAELWAELVVYVAPSDNIEGHAEALAQGGEFITLLWALSTHTGITRTLAS